MVEQYGLKTCLHLRQPMTIDCVDQSNDLIQMYQEIFMVDWTQSTLSLTYFPRHLARISWYKAMEMVESSVNLT